MRLASFLAGGREAIGFEVVEGQLVDLADALRFAGSSAASPPTNMLSLILAGSSALATLRAAHARALKSRGDLKTYSAEEVTWRAPVPSPSKVVCLALNNRALDKIKIRAPTDRPTQSRCIFLIDSGQSSSSRSSTRRSA